MSKRGVFFRVRSRLGGRAGGNPGVRWGYRAGILALVYLTVSAATVMVLAPPAAADLSNTSDAYAQANGRVSAILRVGDLVYLGGSFTQLTNPDGTVVARNNLAAINADTGEVAGWNPDANGSVRAMALSSDGSRLFVGGTFTYVNGIYRGRLAAVDLAAGTVDRGWSAGTNSTVRTLAVSNGSLYAGGDFKTIKGQTRMRLAKLDEATGGLDQNWAPSADQVNTVYGSVRALAFSEDGSRLYAGGYFGSISGQPTGNLVALDPSTGAVDNVFRPNDANGIQAMAVSGGRVFVGTGDNLEGIEAFDGVTGRRDWHIGYGAHAPSEGDVQAMTVHDGTLYAGGHFDKLGDQPKHRLVAVDAATGVMDSQWNPNVAAGNLGVWAIAAYGPHLYVGGDFTTISGQTRERFARFTDGPERPIMGLTGEYFDNMDFTGAKMTRTDARVDYEWGAYSPPGIGPDTFSARWSGQVKSKYTETHTFHTTSDDGVRLWVNGQLIINNWTDHAPKEDIGQISLTAGQKYDIRIEYYERGGGATIKLGWSSPSQSRQTIPQSRLYPAIASP